MNAPSDTQLSSISLLGNQLFEAEREVLRLEMELKRAKNVRDELSQVAIPTAMEEIGLQSFKTDDFEIEIKNVLSVSPPVANRPLVLQKLDELGASALIKSTVTVAFDRGQEEKAKNLIMDLMRQGLEPKQEQKVESQTLKKFVRERLEKGQEVDVDLFGVRNFKQAHFSDGAPDAPVFDGE